MKRARTIPSARRGCARCSTVWNLRRADGALIDLEPRAASRADLERVHDAAYLEQLEAFCAGRRPSRRRHRRERGIVASRRVRGRLGTRRGRRAGTGHRRRGLLRGAATRSSRRAGTRDGVLLAEQRRGDRGASPRPRRARRDRRLGRASRQRHAGHVLVRSRCDVCVHARVAALSGDRPPRRRRHRRRRGHHDQLSAAGGRDGRRLSGGGRHRRRACRSNALPRLGS